MSASAIVCGSAPGFWKDLERALRVAPDADLFGVNFTGLFLHCPRHLVSLHPELLGPLRELRRSGDWCADPVVNGGDPVTHSYRQIPGVDRVWPLPPWHRGGTSSLFATWVALGLGYERVLLAGVPMDGTGRFYDPPNGTAHVWDHNGSDRRPWQQALDFFAGRVRSCSGGWTGELLGEPD